MRTHTYFPEQEGPSPLSRSVERAVRFEETDPMGMVWHGRYPSYFEDARVMLGNSLGIGYLACHAAGLYLPVTHMSIDYKHPIRYGETILVTAILHYTQAARLHTEYKIQNKNGQILCTGSTVQHFTTAAGELCLARPTLYDDLCTRWLAGDLPDTLPSFPTLSHQES